jgi:beta-barrel assembly-enhancing protease
MARYRRVGTQRHYLARGESGFSKGRLILGAVIALIALGSYFFATQENPYTGEQERVAISVEQEVALGLASKPLMIQQMGGAKEGSSPKAQFLSDIGKRLLDEGGVTAALREKAIPWEFSFTLLENDDTVNAFALPGGPIFITEALFDRLENEAQVAGILGHEIGHVIERHSAERMAKDQLQQQLAGAVAVGTGDVSAGQLANYVGNFINMSYGRDQELESDSYALQFLVDAGYDPREMLNVMEILKQASGGGSGPEFMQTHPLPQSRIDAIKAWIEERFPDGVSGNFSKGQDLR